MPYVKLYQKMIFGTLTLTLIGTLAAQVNPLVLKYTIDEVDELLKLPHPMQEGLQLVMFISIILCIKKL